MAEFTGTLCPDDITTVYSRTAVQLGTRTFDNAGNEYIFLKGVASTVAGSWVTFNGNSEFDTTLLAANALGPVAVAQAAITAGYKGWYMIWGVTTACAKSDNEGTLADNAVNIGRSAADGYVDDNATAGDVIYGAICRSAMEASSANTTTLFQIYYPFVDDQTAAH